MTRVINTIELHNGKQKSYGLVQEFDGLQALVGITGNAGAAKEWQNSGLIPADITQQVDPATGTVKIQPLPAIGISEVQPALA